MSRGRLLAGVGFVAATAAVAAVVAMPAQAQEGKILMAGTANAVDGHYIVTLKDTNGLSAKAVTTQSDSLSIKYGAKVATSTPPRCTASRSPRPRPRPSSSPPTRTWPPCR